jgi:hypothetical protein
LHALDGQLRPAPARPGGEQLDVGARGRAEAEDGGEGVEHRIGRQHPALLEPAQVVRAHAGEQRDLFAPQSRDAPVALRGDLDVTGLRVVAPGPQEGTQLGLRLHAPLRSPSGRTRTWSDPAQADAPRARVALSA